MKTKVRGKHDKYNNIYFNQIIELENNAIENAKKLLEKHKKNGESETKSPSATVHLLVEELNKLKS